MSESYFPTVSYAPSISSLKVITFWKRLPSQEIWFRIAVTPTASLETPSRGSRIWIDPKKPNQPVETQLDSVYCIQRTFTHFLHFYKQFSEEFADRRDIHQSLPRLVDRRSMLISKDKDAQRKSELLDQLFVRLLQWPTQVSTSKTIAEFFGVWYCDVDNMGNYSHIPTPNGCLPTIQYPAAGTEERSLSSLQANGPRSSLKSIPYLNHTKSYPDLKSSGKAPAAGAPAPILRPHRSSNNLRQLPNGGAEQVAAASPRRSRSMPSRPGLSPASKSPQKPVPTGSTTLKSSKSLSSGLRRLASTTLARKLTQTFNSRNPPPPSVPVIKNESAANSSNVPLHLTSPDVSTDVPQGSESISHPEPKALPETSTVDYYDNSPTELPLVSASESAPLPRIPSVLFSSSLGNLHDLQQQLDGIQVPSTASPLVEPVSEPEPVPESPPPSPAPVIRHGRLANMQRANTTSKIQGRAKAARLQRIKLGLLGRSDGSDSDNGGASDRSAPPTPPPPFSQLRRNHTTLGRMTGANSRHGVVASPTDSTSTLNRSLSSNDRANNTVQTRIYLNGTILVTIPLLRSELTKPASPRARQAARSTSVEFSRIYTSILRHLHALGGPKAAQASQQIQSFVLVYDTPVGRAVARSEEEIVRAIQSGPRQISCHVIDQADFRLEDAIALSEAQSPSAASDHATQFLPGLNSPQLPPMPISSGPSSPANLNTARPVAPSPAATDAPLGNLSRTPSHDRLAAATNAPQRPPRRDLTNGRRTGGPRLPMNKATATVRATPNPKHLVLNSPPQIKDLLSQSPSTFPQELGVATPTFGRMEAEAMLIQQQHSSEAGANPVAPLTSNLPQFSDFTSTASGGSDYLHSSNESIHNYTAVNSNDDGNASSLTTSHSLVRPKRPSALNQMAEEDPTSQTKGNRTTMGLQVMDSPALPTPFEMSAYKFESESLADTLSPISPATPLGSTDSTASAPPAMRRHPTLSKSNFVMRHRYINRLHAHTDAPNAAHNTKNRLINANTLHLKVILNHETRILIAIPRTAVFSVLWDKVITKFSKAGVASLAQLKTMTLMYIWDDRFEVVNNNTSWREALSLVDNLYHQSPVDQSAPPTPAAVDDVPVAQQSTTANPTYTDAALSPSKSFSSLPSALSRSSSTLFGRRRKGRTPTTGPKNSALDISQYQSIVPRRGRSSSSTNNTAPSTDQGFESVGKLVLYLVPSEMLVQSGRKAMFMNIPAQLMDSAIEASSLGDTPRGAMIFENNYPRNVMSPAGAESQPTPTSAGYTNDASRVAPYATTNGIEEGGSSHHYEEGSTSYFPLQHAASPLGPRTAGSSSGHLPGIYSC
ncbi:hypothetical protein BJ085DRAFT_39866 [Dimargaris cristalligena]|uniref:PX domain-containing protein n=1 Tax=Dimargaris cristalligena TaxID=215637 RepID=A0A4P9ZR90_9FUNG|nr:hypothetical protein BJ085DRAFT_39866 [Dimargaris cristalligena]|eukprot:RKP35261.1 hypothetical protein BJ085DRAFT_39866 [Dimargaris cristalligena]